MIRVKYCLSLLKDSFSEFMEDNALKLSAALSYYTVFSLAPMLLLIISMVSIFFGKEAFEGELYGQLSGLLGKQAALQLQELVKNAAISNKSTTAATVGVLTLLIGATGVFAEIQDSINYIWSIKSKPQKGWLQYLKNRFLSFSLIIALGFLLIVSLGVNSLVDLLSGRIENYFPQISAVLVSGLNNLLVLLIISALFTVIFKVLPDGHVRWKECMVGAAFTAVLFAIGKFAISFYLGKSDLGATYGTSASIVILLTWIYYSSIILYFGAEFTKVYAKSDGIAISPNAHAVLVIRKEAEIDAPEIPQETPSILNAPKRIFESVVHSMSSFVDDKLDAVRAEINGAITKVASPLAYYVLMALGGLMTLVTLFLLLGQLLNRLLASDYLGYVMLLGLMLVVLALIVICKNKFQELLRRLITGFLKQ